MRIEGAGSGSKSFHNVYGFYISKKAGKKTAIEPIEPVNPVTSIEPVQRESNFMAWYKLSHVESSFSLQEGAGYTILLFDKDEEKKDSLSVSVTLTCKHLKESSADIKMVLEKNPWRHFVNYSLVPLRFEGLSEIDYKNDRFSSYYEDPSFERLFVDSPKIISLQDKDILCVSTDTLIQFVLLAGEISLSDEGKPQKQDFSILHDPLQKIKPKKLFQLIKKFLP